MQKTGSLISSNKISERYFSFVSNSSIDIFCPFIKRDALDKILQNSPRISRIISRWEPEELIKGVSDIEVYETCKDNNIDFYINNRIHLKATIKDKRFVFHSSANITNKGLNLNDAIPHNYELSTILNINSANDLVLFEQIVQDSIFVTDDIYEQMKKYLDNIDYEVNEKDPYPIFERRKKFYISQLPMSHDIDILFKIYSDQSTYQSDLEKSCAIHDLSIYSIKTGLNFHEFKSSLASVFFSHPFIQELQNEVQIEGFLYFGRVKEWLQTNCEDVPVPRRRELTSVTQILYHWFEILGEGRYVIDRPNHSQRIKILN